MQPDRTVESPGDSPAEVAAALEVRYELKLEDVAALWMHVNTHSVALRQQRQMGLFLIALLPLLTVFILRELFEMWFGEKPSLGWMMLFLAVWWIILAAGSKRRLARQVEALVSKGEFDTYLGPAVLRLDDNAVHFENRFESHRLSWVAILKIEATEQYFYFFLSEWSAHIVPGRCFASPAEAERFHEYARSRCPTRSRCPKCGYALRGNTTGICPECGTAVS